MRASHDVFDDSVATGKRGGEEDDIVIDGVG